MNVAKINTLNRLSEFVGKINEKQGARPSFPFSSMLKNEVRQSTVPHIDMTNEEEANSALINEFKMYSNQIENGKSAKVELDAESEKLHLEEIQDQLELLMEDGVLSANLNAEMLVSEQFSWSLLLPQDMLQKLQSLFEEGTEITGLLDTENEIQPVENLLATLIHLQQVIVSNDQSNSSNPSSKDSLLSLFQYVNTQLLSQGNKIINQQEKVNLKQLPKELQIFISSIYTKLTGENPLATNSNEKLDYLKSLFQQSIRMVDGSKDNTVQDTSAKVSFVGGENQTPLSRVQQFTLFIEQSGSKMVNQEQFIKEFQNLLTRSSLQNMNGGMKLFIKLYPEHLGQLRIELQQLQGVVTARMVATTAGAKEMLESQIQGLRNAFASQSIQIEKIEIINAGLQQEEFERALTKDGGQHQSSNKEEKDKDKGSGDQSFETAFQEELMNLEV